ncbi:MAG: DUF1289 domain-containing protein [Candidatus Kinetoplastibacterium crithidii]|nr:MAG: DUF1289 domain-containing protein [Candidatus Kinetoplastibacterium crithidii]
MSYKKNHFDSISLKSDSPCIAVCSTLFDDICKGCGRTVYEVSHWVSFTDKQKTEIWNRIRKEGYPKL